MSQPASSRAFALLHEMLQRWIWKQGWEKLHEIQERAIEPILAGDRDVVIAAATAGGKTEAAFLPICSRAATSAPETGLHVLYISPLKALINDQHRRLEELFECVDLPTARWHGDVGQREKRAVRESPRGALLITPESLESVFINHGGRASAMFSHLAYVVVDELHAFIGTERGRHLQSLLHRVEMVSGGPIPRIALSATLGDMEAAAAYLRPDSGLAHEIIEVSGAGQDLRLQVRGYLAPVSDQTGDQEIAPTDAEEISAHLFKVLRGQSNLVFTNRRAETERYADMLRRKSETAGVPNEFWPHHGSLARSLKEDVEAVLQEGRRPATAVCTSTLELGIDIGSVSSIAQIGNPPSVAALRQRLGRSGRRGESAILRIYISEPKLTSQSHPEDLIREDLVQSIAMVRLLLDHWFEPPGAGQLHLSTLLHQVLSLIAERGGVQADGTFQMLCAEGPFSGVAPGEFAHLLRAMGEADLVSQTHDGFLVLGLMGERLVNRYDFYAAFQTPEEYRLRHGGKTLGSLPILFPVAVGTFLIFAGRRWEAIAVDEQRKTIDLRSASGGKLPTFGGRGAYVHDRVRDEMLQIYRSDETPRFLDSHANELLAEGRENFQRLELSNRRVLTFGRETMLFPWRGDRVMNTVVRLFEAEGLKATRGGVSISLATEEHAFRTLVMKLLEGPAVDPVALAEAVENKATNKFDRFLPASLLARDYAVREFDVAGAIDSLRSLIHK